MAFSGVETLSAAAAARPSVASFPEETIDAAPFGTASPGARVADSIPTSEASGVRFALYLALAPPCSDRGQHTHSSHVCLYPSPVTHAWLGRKQTLAFPQSTHTASVARLAEHFCNGSAREGERQKESLL